MLMLLDNRLFLWLLVVPCLRLITFRLLLGFVCILFDDSIHFIKGHATSYL